MKYQLMGNSPAIASLAIDLAVQLPAAEIEWVSHGFSSERLRPLRLRPKTLNKLRKLFSKNSVSAQFLATAPELKAWSPASGALGGSVFFESGNVSDSDRWVDGLELSMKLRALAQAKGVRCVERRPYAYPVFESEIAHVIDVGSQETLAWPAPASNGIEPAHDASKMPVIFCHEIWFPRGRIEEGNYLQFADVERLKLLLEPHPKEGFVLSLFSPAKPLLDKVLQGLKRAQGLGPLSWQALFLLNPGARENGSEVSLGVQKSNLRGVFRMGRSTGQYPPFGNFQDTESFAQAERLLPFLLSLENKKDRVNLLHLTERFNRREAARFEAQFRQAQLWEFLVFSKRFQKSFLQVSAKLPRSLRDILHAPL